MPVVTETILGEAANRPNFYDRVFMTKDSAAVRSHIKAESKPVVSDEFSWDALMKARCTSTWLPAARCQ